MADLTTQEVDLGFDPDALRAKYRTERDKRLRDDGNEQYLQVTGKFAHFVGDPYVEPGFSREPLTDDVDVVIIGGGFGGLLAAARLREAGVTDLRIIEKGGDFGGTWYWNRYPGAQCDIESYIYLPLLEELDYVPQEKYSFAPEILAHSRAIGEKYDLYANACFQTEVTELRWDEEALRWEISTNRGDRMKARYVCMSNGPLNRPKLPGIEGIESFEGHTFHTSRWDYAYTGGDSNGNLTGLEGKRVGIIGTGATAVQCVPHLAESAEQLYVFQRTPSSIDVRGNKPTDPGWVKALESGWQEHRMRNFNTLVSGGVTDEDLVNDGWTDIIGNLIAISRSRKSENLTMEEMGARMELADFQKMEQIRSRVDELVEDSATAEALKPYYRQFCKRPCFHDDYLPSFNRPNVKLVDTQGRGVERITEKGVVVDGHEYEIDCLILATGFEVGTSYNRRAGYEIIGRKRQTLSEKWANGMRTFHGFQTNGFPNCYFMGVTQGGFTANFPHLLNEQSVHIAYMISHGTNNNVHCMEATKEAEDEWVDTIKQMAIFSKNFLENCTPGYYNNEGKPGQGNSLIGGQYGGGPVAFFKILQDWREEGSLQGLTFS
ncbi:MAG: NAD(P)/FAD-dependent oxidoreductase [Gammaproteobacteria bacterium]|nr:MAG: NAD(P)/FAD-dependent oxidoreductase [Gammaproteobacteria bacterium]